MSILCNSIFLSCSYFKISFLHLFQNYNKRYILTLKKYFISFTMSLIRSPYCAAVFAAVYSSVAPAYECIASYSLKRMKISCKKYYLHHCHHHRCPYPRKITKKKQTQDKEGGNHKLVRLYDYHFQFVIIKPFWGRLPFVAEKIKIKNSSTFLGRRRMSQCENQGVRIPSARQKTCSTLLVPVSLYLSGGTSQKSK